MKRNKIIAHSFFILIILCYSSLSFSTTLDNVMKRGELRHLGVPYANFVTGLGDGFSVELVKGFCDELGVKYVYVQTSWDSVIGDLTGYTISVEKGRARITGKGEVRGDMIANGLTRLAWREELVAYSDPILPTRVMLVASMESPLEIVKKTHDPIRDVRNVIRQLNGISILGKGGTCIDKDLYDFGEVEVRFVNFPGNLNDLIPAIISRKAAATMLDLPDVLIALGKWPDKIKVIGPISEEQVMGAAFTKDAVRLREMFNKYLRRIKSDGTFYTLVMKYFPLIIQFDPDFFIDVQKR